MRKLTDHEKNTLQNIITSIDTPIFMGSYNPDIFSEEFMSGIATAMEFFTSLVDDDFCNEFMENYYKKTLDNKKNF